MGFGIEQMEVFGDFGTFTLWPGMSHDDIVMETQKRGADNLYSAKGPPGAGRGHWEIVQDRCFIEPEWALDGRNGTKPFARTRSEGYFASNISKIIHLPGLRGNPERTYPATALGPSYPGTFEKYTASVITQWVSKRDGPLEALNADLKLLQLAEGVTAVRVNDVQIELHVGRLPGIAPTRPEDRVNIADVGLGVSQTLPFLVALHAAKPGQLVYVEQPETHLHPRAQSALAQVLAAAATRGVRVVVETHSSILLLGVQTLVAEGKLEPDMVKLHWFQREKDGRTLVRSGDLDNAGAFGDWPEDFSDVDLKTESRYIDAAHDRLIERKHG